MIASWRSCGINREAYFGNLERHFDRHLQPFRYIDQKDGK